MPINYHQSLHFIVYSRVNGEGPDQLIHACSTSMSYVPFKFVRVRLHLWLLYDRRGSPLLFHLYSQLFHPFTVEA